MGADGRQDELFPQPFSDVMVAVSRHPVGYRVTVTKRLEGARGYSRKHSSTYRALSRDELVDVVSAELEGLAEIV